jgi:hypothetical protein
MRASVGKKVYVSILRGKTCRTQGQKFIHKRKNLIEGQHLKLALIHGETVQRRDEEEAKMDRSSIKGEKRCVALREQGYTAWTKNRKLYHAILLSSD